MKKFFFFIIPAVTILGAISCEPKEKGHDESLTLSGINFGSSLPGSGLIYKYQPNSGFNNPIDSVAWSAYP